MRMMSIVIAVLTLVLAADSFSGSLSGRMIEDSTAIPLWDAEVTVHVVVPDSIALFDTTDAAGLYSFPFIPPANQFYVITEYKS